MSTQNTGENSTMPKENVQNSSVHKNEPIPAGSEESRQKSVRFEIDGQNLINAQNNRQNTTAARNLLSINIFINPAGGITMEMQENRRNVVNSEKNQEPAPVEAQESTISNPTADENENEPIALDLRTNVRVHESDEPKESPDSRQTNEIPERQSVTQLNRPNSQPICTREETPGPSTAVQTEENKDNEEINPNPAELNQTEEVVTKVEADSSVNSNTVNAKISKIQPIPSELRTEEVVTKVGTDSSVNSNTDNVKISNNAKNGREIDIIDCFSDSEENPTADENKIEIIDISDSEYDPTVKSVGNIKKERNIDTVNLVSSSDEEESNLGAAAHDPVALDRKVNKDFLNAFDSMRESKADKIEAGPSSSSTARGHLGLELKIKREAINSIRTQNTAEFETMKMEIEINSDYEDDGFESTDVFTSNPIRSPSKPVPSRSPPVPSPLSLPVPSPSPTHESEGEYILPDLVSPTTEINEHPEIPCSSNSLVIEPNLLPPNQDGNDCPICQTPNDGSRMILCSDCDWIHFRCIGFPLDKVIEDDFEFICPLCTAKKTQTQEPPKKPGKKANAGSVQPVAKKKWCGACELALPVLGGVLPNVVLPCGSCTASFHLGCIGLKSEPKDLWECNRCTAAKKLELEDEEETRKPNTRGRPRGSKGGSNKRRKL